MKRPLIFLLGILAFSCLNGQSFSPEVFSSGGEVMGNDNVAFYFTIGEPVIETFTIDDDAIFTQGFQQPWDFTVHTLELVESGYDIKAYPNPTSGFLTLDFLAVIHEPVTFQLTDLWGRVLLLETTKGSTGKIQIDIGAYSANIFLLSVFLEEGRVIKSFKIQKTK